MPGLRPFRNTHENRPPSDAPAFFFAAGKFLDLNSRGEHEVLRYVAHRTMKKQVRTGGSIIPRRVPLLTAGEEENADTVLQILEDETRGHSPHSQGLLLQRAADPRSSRAK